MLSLSALSTTEFWCQYTFENDGTTQVPLVVVLPSGRHPNAGTGQLALISDALFTHEVVLEIDRIIRSASLGGVSLQTMLDIDYYETLERAQHSKHYPSEDPLSPLNANLLLLATADINIVVQALLSQSDSYKKYGCGYAPPYEQCILVGAKKKQYPGQAYPWVGALGLYEVPWSHQKRVAIFSGGIFAVGTLAGTALLLKYLRGEERQNNRYLPTIPLKIVSATPKDYDSTILIPLHNCMPQHDLRNIDEDAGLTVHE